MTVSFHFIDICYPDNLQDHHNRDNEHLVSIEWQEDFTDRELIEEIVDVVLFEDLEMFKYLSDDVELCRVQLTQIITDEIIGIDLSMPNVDTPEEMMIYGYFCW